MSEFINTVDIIGDDVLCDELITRTVQEYKESRITKIGMAAFYKCSELTSVDVPNVIAIYDEAFASSALVTLILRGSIATLSNINAFEDTSISSGVGYIYVPAALMDSYKTATNWSTYASQFRALEDYTVDGTVTGELDETKI